MSLGKNLNQCKRCVTIPLSSRQFSSGGSNALQPEKMHAKTLVLTQWKLVNQLKSYIAKLSPDKTFEVALNEEFARFLRKIQPGAYGTELVRYFESLAVPLTRTGSEKKDQEGAKVEEVKAVKKTVPKWREAAVTVSKESVVSMTQYIMTKLKVAKSDFSKLARIEELNAHLKSYPEAQHGAVKAGAIRLLLRARRRTSDKDIQEASNEALSLLGYASPVPGTGVRILSIDGGGIRGVVVVEMLKKLEELAGRPVHEMFDMICGVSTGAIIASLIGIKNKSLEEISEIYLNISTQVFAQSALKGTSSLMWNHSYYDTSLWERLLKDQIGEQTLISTSRNATCPKLCALSAVVNQTRTSAYVFRNYSLPYRIQSLYRGSHEHKIWEAVRASAAAPTYFQEFKLKNMLHQDGGILFNNPTAVAIHEAKLLWPTTPIQCVVSFGTGRSIPNPVDLAAAPTTNTSWREKLMTIIESATDTEGVHTMLSDLLPGHAYYRFNPYLTEMLDIAEIDPKKLDQLKKDATMYSRTNEDKFQDAAKALNVEKGLSQKVLDWLNLQIEIQGFNA